MVAQPTTTRWVDFDVPPRIYGYTMWMPGLVFATSFAAAAAAKLRESGVAWITNGTVNYHFLTDAHQAPVDWGLRLAQHESVAVFMSFAAIALEATLIVGVFSKRYRYRAAAGAADWPFSSGSRCSRVSSGRCGG